MVVFDRTKYYLGALVQLREHQQGLLVMVISVQGLPVSELLGSELPFHCLPVLELGLPGFAL